MKCQRCGRAILSTPAASVKTRSGPLHYGPKCAALMGILPPAVRHAKTTAAKPQTPDDGQLDLFAGG